ncbi:thiaminase II [Klebsiella pneumoniae]|nr:thiaminase II [Klebsiella pneumoniae]
MIVPAFSQGLYGRLRQLAAADWQRYVAHPFVQQLASGTLAENAFRRYLTQDYLFLIHFARSYALLVSKTAHAAGDAGRGRLDECHPQRTAAARRLLCPVGD